eukprot:Trichotokara_eunicae@DN2423_c0_g1_i1.p1
MNEKFKDSVKRYEEFVENVIENELEVLTSQRDGILLQLQELRTLKSRLELLKKSKKKEFDARVDVGGGVFFDAFVPECKPFIETGFGFYLQMNLDEKLFEFLQNKKEFLEGKLKHFDGKVSKVQSRIEVMGEALQAAMHLHA